MTTAERVDRFLLDPTSDEWVSIWATLAEELQDNMVGAIVQASRIAPIFWTVQGLSWDFLPSARKFSPVLAEVNGAVKRVAEVIGEETGVGKSVALALGLSVVREATNAGQD